MSGEIDPALRQADQDVMRMLRGASFAPGAKITLPSGRAVYPGARRATGAQRLRFRSMYALSYAIGWLVALTIAALDYGRLPRRASLLIRCVARAHAVDAARKRGPYLAPISVLAIVLLALAAVAWLAS